MGGRGVKCPQNDVTERAGRWIASVCTAQLSHLTPHLPFTHPPTHPPHRHELEASLRRGGMAFSIVRAVAAAAALMLVNLCTGTTALPPACQQLGVALSSQLMGKTVAAGKRLHVIARVRNRAPAAVRGLGVKITLPPNWNVTSSKASPGAGLARKAATVVGGSTAYWVDMPLSGGKARRFKLQVRVPACQPAAATGLGIGIAAYLTEPGGGAGAVTCISEGETARVSGAFACD
jgi:hypothetical protein